MLTQSLPLTERADGSVPPGPFEPVWTSADGARMPVVQPAAHPAYSRVMAKIPEPVRKTFSEEQIASLVSAMLPPAKTNHRVDWRVSLPWFGRRFYVTILAGPEKRSMERLIQEGMIDYSRISFMYGVSATLLFASLATVTIIGAYVIKSMIGLDIMEGPSPLHDFIYPFLPR